MPGYTSKYVPIDFAIKRIAEHHFGGDEIAAWADVAVAIKEGAITKRPHTTPRARHRNQDDMLSSIVGNVVLGNQPEDNQEVAVWPEETLLRREIEEIYDPIFAEDGGSTPPKRPADKQIGFVGRPSKMNAIIREMRRRAKEGILCSTLAAEARALCKWGKEKFPDDQIPKERAMENAIRSEYWKLQRTPI